jgi:flagellar basal body-associated protein FliL
MNYPQQQQKKEKKIKIYLLLVLIKCFFLSVIMTFVVLVKVGDEKKHISSADCDLQP